MFLKLLMNLGFLLHFVIQPKAIHDLEYKRSTPTASLVLHISLASLPASPCGDSGVTNLSAYKSPANKTSA